ncbi:alanine--tRNA ligase [bacterium]|nr:MAG: alanine--tRNA ligase [bacterium]
MKADILRDKFLEFFKSKKHKVVASDSLVPQDDPTVLFTPAGMNQFKKQFLGFITDFTRATSSQRCLRTDDLDKVGKTSVHHTFFEMLGNFSFGDYFKEEAIAWAWEFLTEELKIKEDKLWVSVYKDDDEAYDIWKNKIKVPPGKIIKLGDKDNFWPAEAKEKGPNGPCGPCSEIFYDFGVNPDCKNTDCNPACNCGRFAEVWNLVFTQFNRKDNGKLEPLPKKNIDTGMGLERLAAVMQGVSNNFETDLFQPIIKEIARELGITEVKNKGLIYAVSDHLRAIVFSIYDGVLPSNEGRGYIVRKLIRKSIQNLFSFGATKPCLHRLVPVLAEVMEKPYPDLKARREDIAEIILAEEKNFIAILKSSDALIKERFDPQKKVDTVFALYDTHGIPLELTAEWLAKNGYAMTKEETELLNKRMEEQKNRSRSQSSMKGDVFDLKGLSLDMKETKFLGYKEYLTRAKILKILKGNVEVKKAAFGEEVKIILDKTVFYPESGGQVGDTGEISKGKNVFEVSDTHKLDKTILHLGKIKHGTLKNGDLVTITIDTQRRENIARNHTATHLLQAALRKVLGQHIQQQGSLVTPEKLRFDFSHFKGLNREELDRVEEEVNNFIMDNYPVESKEMLISQAKKSGALAFFGEKYGSKVRMVSVSEVSRELCGGTHIDATGSIGIFKILQESSSASGVRRIEAATGVYAYREFKNHERIITEAASLLNVSKERVAEQLEEKLSYIKSLQKQQSVKKMDDVKGLMDKLIRDAGDINGIKIVCSVLEDADLEVLRKAMDLIKQGVQTGVVALGGVKSGKVFLVVGLTSDLVEKGMDASKIIREIASPIGGSGGGRKDFAQSGGSKPEGFPVVFSKLKEMIK